jgi:hypothetical protein
MLDRNPDLALDRRGREGAGQLLAAERGLARPEKSRGPFERSGLPERVPLPVTVRIPAHAVARDLEDQAGVVAMIEDADLDRIDHVLWREHGVRAGAQQQGRGEGESAKSAAVRDR